MGDAAGSHTTSTFSPHTAAWNTFSKRVEGLIQAVVGLCGMFVARQLPCPLKTLESSITHMTGSRFDEVTLRVLLAIAPSLLSVAFNDDDIGASQVTLVIHEEPLEPAPSTQPSSTAASSSSSQAPAAKRRKTSSAAPAAKQKKANRSNSTGFRGVQPIKDFEEKIAKLKEDFRERLVIFRSRREADGHIPPPLNSEEKEERAKLQAQTAKKPDSSAPDTTSRKAMWDASRAVTVDNFFDYVQTLKWYEDQLKAVHRVDGRAPSMVSLESLSFVSTAVRTALAERGITQLYSHQAQALAVLMSGESLEAYTDTKPDTHEQKKVVALTPDGPSSSDQPPPCNAGASSSTSPLTPLASSSPPLSAAAVASNGRCQLGTRACKDVIITTATASGKSVCYTAPFLQAAAADPDARAFFIFPTKALAQDQMSSLRRFASACGMDDLGISTYDGDTPKPQRDTIRDANRLLLTNPDMLHISVLPQAKKWADVLSNLKLVVVDEAHMYRGAFGCHVAMILRRLIRLCMHFSGGMLDGRRPTVVMCSATIANPRDHMVNLTGLNPDSIVVIDRDGSPCGERVFGFWNPPLHPSATPPSVPPELDDGLHVDGDRGGEGVALTSTAAAGPSSAAAGGGGKKGGDKKGGRGGGSKKRARATASAHEDTISQKSDATQQPTTDTAAGGAGGGAGVIRHGSADLKSNGVTRTKRRSPYTDAAKILSELVQRRIRTLCFVKVRSIAELILSLTREYLPDAFKTHVASYRAGYLPQKRRELEQGLSSGRLVGVVTTNALELGVDIGQLDATIHVGFPSTVSSLMQQAGRAGRAGGTSLSIVIALDSPLDQYLVSHPSDVLSRAVEPALADPTNPVVLSEHLTCAMYEMPLVEGEGGFCGPEVEDVLDEMRRENKVVRNGIALELATRHRKVSPASSINIRSVDSTMYELVDQATGQLLETTEAQTVFYRVYEGAVYLHQGESYIVKELDLDKRVAHLRKQNVTYFTETRDHTRVSILGFRRYETLTFAPPTPIAAPPGTTTAAPAITEVKADSEEKKPVAMAVDGRGEDGHGKDSTAQMPMPVGSGGGAAAAADGGGGDSEVKGKPWELEVRCGPVTVVKQVYGYKMRDKRSSRVTDVVDVYVPPMQYNTVAVWMEVPVEIKQRFRAFDPRVRKFTYDHFDQGGLHAIEHLLCALAPLEVMCDPADLSCQHTRRETDVNRDKLLLYETCRGGMGLSSRLIDRFPSLLTTAYRVVKGCPCEDGCLGCIRLGSCYEGTEDKQAAVEILRALLEEGKVG